MDMWWWDSDLGKASITCQSEVDAGLFIKSIPNQQKLRESAVVGQVTRIIYAGYKVEQPDGSMVTFNLKKEKFEKICEENYPQESQDWLSQKKEKVNCDLEVAENRKKWAQEIKTKQNNCSHTNVKETTVVACCYVDIDDTYCTSCNQILIRYWCTNKDDDPKPNVTDWDWYVSYYTKKYGVPPNQANYNIVYQVDPI